MKEEDKTFTKAPHYKSTEQDIIRAEKRRKAEAKKEELRLKRELDSYY